MFVVVLLVTHLSWEYITVRSQLSFSRSNRTHHLEPGPTCTNDCYIAEGNSFFNSIFWILRFLTSSAQNANRSSHFKYCILLLSGAVSLDYRLAACLQSADVLCFDESAVHHKLQRSVFESNLMSVKQ